MAGHCQKCGYDLTGLPEPRCPECGEPFDPNAPPKPVARPGADIGPNLRRAAAVFGVLSLVLAIICTYLDEWLAYWKLSLLKSCVPPYFSRVIDWLWIISFLLLGFALLTGYARMRYPDECPQCGFVLTGLYVSRCPYCHQRVEKIRIPRRRWM